MIRFFAFLSVLLSAGFASAAVLIDDFEGPKPGWTTWADAGTKGVDRTLVPDAAEGKQAMRITFPPVAHTAVIGRQGMRIPAGVNAIGLWIKLESGRPQTMLTVMGKESGDTFVAPLPATPAWQRVVIPFEQLEFQRSATPGSNRKLDAESEISINFLSYRNAEKGVFLIDRVEWLTVAPEPVGQGRKNRMPGDSGFESGIGGWIYFCAPMTLRAAEGDAFSGHVALPIDGTSWILCPWTNDLLLPGAEHTLSFYVKGAAGSRLTATIRTLGWRNVAEKTFDASPEWTRCVMRIPAQSKAEPTYVAFSRPSGNPATILVDDIQLETGSEATPYAPSQAVSLYGTTGKSGEIVPESETPVLAVRIFNTEIPEKEQPFRLVLTDAAGTVRGKAEFSLPAGSGKSLTFDCDFARTPGYYPMTAVLRDGNGTLLKEQNLPFVVAPVPDPVRKGEGFCGLHIDYTPQDAMRAIGVSWVRANTTHWNAVEPEQGTFSPMSTRDFSATGLNWFATLLDVARAPRWAQGADGLVAAPEMFGPFVDYALKCTGKEVQAYELQNEPDLTMVSARVSPELAAANYAGLVDVAGQRILGAGGHLGINGSGEGSRFIESVFRLAGKSFDLYAPHTYTFPRFFGPNASFAAGPEAGKVREQLLHAVELIRRYGHGQQLWIGEFGYGLDVAAPFDSEWSRRHAAFLARTMIWCRTVPELRRIMWFTGLGTLEQKRYEYGIWRNDNGIRPLPAAAAYAAAAKRVDGAENFRIRSDGDIKIVSWEKNGTPCLAIWNAAEYPEKIEFDLSPEDATVADCFGTPVAGPFEAGEAPFYLQPKPGRFDAVLARLTGTLGKRRPLLVSGRLRTNRLLVLQVRNALEQPYRGRAGLDGTPDRKLELAPGGETELEFALPHAAPQSGSVLRPRFTADDGTVFSPEIRIPELLAIPYHKLPNWQEFAFGQLRPALVLNRREQIYPADPFIKWSGPEDLSANVWLFWDDANFYLMAEVCDDEFSQPFRGGDIWKGDAMQFAFDAGNDARDGGGYDNNDYEYGAALAASGIPELWCWQAAAGKPFPGTADRLQAVIEHKGKNRLLYRIAIPWSELAPFGPRAGAIAGFNLAFPERDGAVANSHLQLAPGLAPFKNPSRFRRIVLER